MKSGLAAALAVAVVGQVLYQLMQKLVSHDAHPVLSLLAFYLLAAVMSLPLFWLYPLDGGLAAVGSQLQKLNWAVAGVAAAIVLIELGFLLAYRAGGNPIELEQALQHYQGALRIRRESLPVDHPDLAISYYNLALVHIDQLDYERAWSELQQALAIQRTKLPDNHPDLLQTLKVEQQIKAMFPDRALLGTC